MKKFHTAIFILLSMHSLNMCLSSFGTTVCDTRVSLTKRKLNAVSFKSTPDLIFSAIIPGTTSCYLELDSIISGMLSHIGNKANSNGIYCQLQLFCSYPLVIRFNTTRILQRIQNLHILLDSTDCSMYLTDLYLFSEIGSLFSLTQFTEDTRIIVGKKTECPFAETLNIMECYIDYKGQGSQTFGHFFWEQCTEIYTHLKALVLTGHKKRINYWNFTNFADKFPKLRTLMFQYIDLQMPVKFNWNVTPAYQGCTALPNITKEDFPSAYLSVPAFYGRSSNNLSDIYLQGNLFMIELENMTTSCIRGTFFEAVHGLKVITIHGNKLSTLDDSLFQSTTCLQILMLHSNNISYLHDRTFRKLKMLYKLSLADNRLKSVSSKLLEPLVSLQELHLERNLISHLPLDIFTKQLKLRKLYIFDNPLVDIPFWAVYLPFIELIDCHQTKINDDSFIALTKHYSAPINGTALSIPACSKPLTPRKRKFDLSNSNITNFDVISYGKIERSVFTYMFCTYNVITTGNPIRCYCDIESLLKLLRILYNSGITSDLVCQSPTEFRQRSLVTIDTDELYCPITTPGCPRVCSCFERIDEHVIIVNCRNVNVTHLPSEMPGGKSLELWFENAGLEKIELRPYLVSVVGFDASNNSISYIDPLAISHLRNARYVYLDSNKLRDIPSQIKTLNLTKLTLRGNPLLCDCNTLWLKQWIIDMNDTLKDWADIECSDATNEIKQVIAVSDDMFVCSEPVSTSLMEKLFVPSAISVSTLFVLVAVSVLVYFQRFNLKVLLYIKFGIDPFYNHPEDIRSFKYDAFMVLGPADALLARDTIAKHFLHRNYKIAFFEKDFIVGYSIIENVTKLLQMSRRVIFLLSKETLQNPILRIVWNLAYERARDISMKYIILIANKNFKKHCKEDIVLKFLKNNRFIQMESKLLNESVEYMMPRRRVKDDYEMSHSQLPADPEETDLIPVLTYYPDTIRYYIRHELRPFLLRNAFDIRDIDDEFLPGTDIRDEIFEVLDRAEHFIYILSAETVLDDVQMYILYEAVTKTMLGRNNYLLLVIKDHVDINALSTKLQNYIEYYAVIKLNSENFKQRILEALKYDKECPEVQIYDEESNNDPLLE